MEALVIAGKPLIEAQGIFLPHCTEAQIDSVTALTVAENNALKCERSRLLTLLSQSQGFDHRSLRFHTEPIIRKQDDNGEIKDVNFGEMLIVDALPGEMVRRYGAASIPSKIYIRKCYEELYEHMAAEMVTTQTNTLFTGVPGIGKSMFLIYFLYRYQIDGRFPDKQFALEFQSGVYHYYKPIVGAQSEFLCSRLVGSTDILDNILVLVDTTANVPPENHAKWTLIFSSPNPNRHREFLKAAHSYKLWVPTWSQRELWCVNENIAVWYNRFVLCGGIARIVLWDNIGKDPMIVLSESLQDKGAIIAEYFFKHGFGNIDPYQSYSIVHNNPPVDENGRCVYNASSPAYTFASDTVFKQLAATFTSGLVAETIGWFNAGGGLVPEKLGGASAGNLFEKICLRLVPIAGRLITISILPVAQSAANSASINIHIPSMEKLAYNWNHACNHQAGVLYQPLISNLESGDAFCLIEYQNQLALIVLQVTVGEKHPVKANGLKDIVQSFPLQIKTQIVRKMLVFVTPFEGKLRTVQPIHNQDDNVMAHANIPIDARDF